MTGPEEVMRVIAAPPGTIAGPPGHFGPDHPYAEVWLSVIGPASWLIWHRLATGIDRSVRDARRAQVATAARNAPPDRGPDAVPNGATITLIDRWVESSSGVETSVGELSGALGLGPPGGNQSRIRRALRRLERHRLLHAVDAEVWLLRHRLPYLPAATVPGLPVAVRAVHDRTAAAAVTLGEPTPPAPARARR